jgi:hypothetical protein
MIALIAIFVFMSKLEPAYSIVTRLGGASAVAPVCNVHVTRVYSWMRERENGGTNGLIPQRHHLALLDLARASDVPLTAADFLPRRIKAEAQA